MLYRQHDRFPCTNRHEPQPRSYSISNQNLTRKQQHKRRVCTRYRHFRKNSKSSMSIMIENKCVSKQHYPATVFVDKNDIYIGLIIDKSSNIILDAQWQSPDHTDILSNLSIKLIGTTIQSISSLANAHPLISTHLQLLSDNYTTQITPPPKPSLII